MISSELLEAYAKTEYHIDVLASPILVYQRHTEVDNLLIEHDVEEWAYLTSFNPFSQLRSEAENLKSNLSLKNDLANYQTYSGSAIDPKGEWPNEDGFLALGLSHLNANELAQKYRQNAFLYGKLNQPTTLQLTKRGPRPPRFEK